MSWPVVSLGSCTNTCRTWNPSSDDPSGSFSYIDLSSVDKDTKAIEGVSTIFGSDAPSRARQIVAAGDILVSTVRPNLNGVALVGQELDGATASTGFTVLRPDKSRVHASYLFHWVKHPSFVDEMVRRATGASYPAVSDKIVREAQIPLPPLSEQRRIAEILDKADTLRTKRRNAIAKLDQLLQSFFLDMFGDPVTNPKGWSETKTLGEVADIVSGITKGRVPRSVTREVTYLAVSNVQDRALKLDIVKKIDATDDEIKRYKLQADDLVLTEGGDPDKLGRGALWDGSIPECIHQNHVFRVRVTSQNLIPVYLNWQIGSERGKRYFAKQAKQTTGIASINMRQLRAFPLLIPPLDLQRKFALAVKSIERQKRALQRHADRLDTFFASLQHRAFAGEL